MVKQVIQACIPDYFIKFMDKLYAWFSRPADRHKSFREKSKEAWKKLPPVMNELAGARANDGWRLIKLEYATSLVGLYINPSAVFI